MMEIIKSYLTPFYGSEFIILSEKDIFLIKNRIKLETNIKEILDIVIYNSIIEYLEKNGYLCFFNYKGIIKFMKRKV